VERSAATAARPAGVSGRFPRYLGALARRAVRELLTPLVEWRLGIRTVPPALVGRRWATRNADAVEYEALNYPALARLLRLLELRGDDVVFDIGCGAGRMLCMAARQRVRCCVGIEIAPELAALARLNAGRLRGRRAPIEIREQDAVEADYRGASVLLLYNPFGPVTLRDVLARVAAAADPAGPALRLLYINPFHGAVLESMGWRRRQEIDFGHGPRASIWVREALSRTPCAAGR
jgi:SAM-dependent methyltransferase